MLEDPGKAEAQRTDSKHECSDDTPSNLKPTTKLATAPSKAGCLRRPHHTLFQSFSLWRFQIFFVLPKRTFKFCCQHLKCEKSGVSVCKTSGRRPADVGHVGRRQANVRQTSSTSGGKRQADVGQMSGLGGTIQNKNTPGGAQHQVR